MSSNSNAVSILSTLNRDKMSSVDGDRKRNDSPQSSRRNGRFVSSAFEKFVRRSKKSSIGDQFSIGVSPSLQNTSFPVSHGKKKSS